MKILFDTNVLLDVLLSREPWYRDRYTLWQYHDQAKIRGYVTATTLTDIFYIARRYSGPEGALKAVESCLVAFPIIAVGRDELEEALQLPGKDFEDNLQIACASLMDLDVIVTRNAEDYVHATISVLTPAALLEKLDFSRD